MLFFKKKKSTISSMGSTATPVTPTWESHMHVMPERFYVRPSRRRVWPWFVVAGVVFAAVVAIVWVRVDIQPGDEPVAVNQPSSNMQPVVVEPPTSPVEPIPVPTTTPEVVVVEPSATTTPPTPPAEPAPVLFRAADIDADGLSAAEESLYGTDGNLVDTDGDSYSDGNELQHGYDPTKPGAALADGVVVTTYQAVENFTIDYPVRWTVGTTSVGGVQFMSAIGEGVEVVMIDNPDRLELRVWYQQAGEAAPINEFVDVMVSSANALKSFDGLTYYVSSPNRSAVVYRLRYQAGTSQQINFFTTFVMMVQSLRLASDG